jgi:hypothetical protein
MPKMISTCVERRVAKPVVEAEDPHAKYESMSEFNAPQNFQTLNDEQQNPSAEK